MNQTMSYKLKTNYPSLQTRGSAVFLKLKSKNLFTIKYSFKIKTSVNPKNDASGIVCL